MNREIKFRAWQKWHEYMFTPDYIDFKRIGLRPVDALNKQHQKTWQTGF